jgi:hypothetical protein
MDVDHSLTRPRTGTLEKVLQDVGPELVHGSRLGPTAMIAGEPIDACHGGGDPMRGKAQTE